MWLDQQLARIARRTPPPRVEPDVESAGPSTAVQLRIVVIDDDPLAANGLSAILTSLGHDVVATLTGNDGLEAILRVDPDVVLCDLGLPDIDGFEVAERVRNDAATAHVKLIAVTGYQRPIPAVAVAAGFDAYLVKPVDLKRLTAILKRVRHG